MKKNSNIEQGDMEVEKNEKNVNELNFKKFNFLTQRESFELLFKRFLFQKKV